MKKAEAFTRKRKVRDKANRRWIKNRHWVVPGFLLLTFVGGTLGATFARAFADGAIFAGFFVGALAATAIGGSYIVRNLSK